jgi:hypothetical protein
MRPAISTKLVRLFIGCTNLVLFFGQCSTAPRHSTDRQSWTIADAPIPGVLAQFLL